MVYKSANYGSLTYVLPSNDTSFLTLNEVDKRIVEANLASKLLGAHFHKDEQGKKKNLIEGSNNKTSLICDYRGFIWCDLKLDVKDSVDREACKKIDKHFIPLEVQSIQIVLEFNNRSQQRFVIKPYKDLDVLDNIIIYNIPFHYVVNNVQHNFILIYQSTKGKVKGKYDLHLGYCVKNIQSGEIFGNYTFQDITLKKYIKVLPSLIVSKYY